MGHRHHFSLHSRPSTTIHFGNISNCSILVGRRCPHRLKLRQCRHPSAVFKFHGERGKPRGEGEKEGGEESRGTIIPAAAGDGFRNPTDSFQIPTLPFKNTQRRRDREERREREQGGLPPKRRVENMEKVSATSSSTWVDTEREIHESWTGEGLTPQV